MDDKKSSKENSQNDYQKALASEDPTDISNSELEDLAQKAIKKFKSLG